MAKSKYGFWSLIEKYITSFKGLIKDGLSIVKINDLHEKMKDKKKEINGSMKIIQW